MSVVSGNGIHLRLLDVPVVHRSDNDTAVDTCDDSARASSSLFSSEGKVWLTEGNE